MKQLIFISLFIFSLISAQQTSYTNYFDGELTASAPSSFSLIQKDGYLTVDVNKEASKLWQSIEIPFENRIDINSFPYLNIKLKSNKPTLLTIHIVDAFFVQQTKNLKVYASDEFVNYFIDYSANSSITKDFINKIRITPNGNSVDEFQCKLVIDEIKLGTDAEFIAGTGSVGNQKVFINSRDNEINLLDLKNVEMIEVSSKQNLITNIRLTDQSSSRSMITYDCVSGFIGNDTLLVTLTGEENFRNNLLKIPIEIEGNNSPYFDQIVDYESVIGDTLKIELTGITDGNSSADQKLKISAVSNNQKALPDSNIYINHNYNLPKAELIVIPVHDTSNIEITVTLDDQFGSNNIYSQTFNLNTFIEFNNLPTINPLSNQFIYLENNESSFKLTEISDGDNNTQELLITARSSNQSVIPDSVLEVEYNQGNSEANLLVTPTNIGESIISITIIDNGGNEFNNGNSQTTISFKIEVLNLPLNGHIADFSSFNNWGLDTGSGQQNYELGSFKGKNDVLKITMNQKSCWTGTVYNCPEMDLDQNRYLSYDIYFEGESFENFVGGRTHSYLYDEGWDPDFSRNLPAAHNERKFAYPGEWVTVFMDFRGSNGIENSEGEDINIKRIQKVLLNYASNFTWPFPIDNGTVYIANLRIGDAVPDSLISPIESTCSIDPIPNKTTFISASEIIIPITGISSGLENSSSPDYELTISDTSIIQVSEIGVIDSKGNSEIKFTLKEKLGRTNVSIRVFAEGSNDRMTNFFIDVVDDNIANTVDIELFPDSTFQTIRGFGTFQFSDRDSYVNKYTTELGASAVRIGIISNQIEPENDNNDPNVLDLSAYNYDAFNFEYYKKLKANGVETFILTSWSPPAWMKRNLSVDYGYASAPFYEATDNILEPYYYDEFAESMVAVVKMFKERADINLYAIGIQNEPAFNEPYASAVLSPEKFAELISIVGKRFHDEGLTTKLYMPEQVFSQGHYSMSEYITTLFNHAEAQNYVDIIATHSYDADGIQPGQPSFPGWRELWNNSQMGIEPKELWMSETYPESNNWDDAMSLAGAIYGALKYGNVSLWTLWNIEGTLLDTGSKLSQFYTSQNYYKFIRPGSKRIQANSGNNDILVTSFIDDKNDKLTTVIINKNSEPITVRIIGRTDSIPSSYDTYTSAKNINFEFSGKIKENETLALLGQSVTTLVGEMNSELVLDINEEIIPNGYKLYQNYPNPFNPTTTIKFGIRNAGNVKLIIYNLLGQKVKSIVDKYHTPGNYEYSFNASNLASGVYFYRIKTDHFTQVKKMILLK